MRGRSCSAWMLAAALTGPPVLAQEPAGVPAANPADVESVGAILTAVYDVISGPRGAQRDWDRMRSLFYPGARLIPAGPRPDGSGAVARITTLDGWIEGAERFFADSPFYEVEVARRTERFGNIAHSFSTYESRSAPNDPEPFARGINSFQLLKDGARWWIINIFWQAEGPGNPIPAVYNEGTP